MPSSRNRLIIHLLTAIFSTGDWSENRFIEARIWAARRKIVQSAPTIFLRNDPAFKVIYLIRATRVSPSDAEKVSCLKAVCGPDEVPVYREPGEKQAGERDQRELQLRNKANLGAPPDSQASHGREDAEENREPGDQVHHHKIFVHVVTRQHRFILQEGHEDRCSDGQNNPCDGGQPWRQRQPKTGKIMLLFSYQK